jgi:hypothetical protein
MMPETVVALLAIADTGSDSNPEMASSKQALNLRKYFDAISLSGN